METFILPTQYVLLNWKQKNDELCNVCNEEEDLNFFFFLVDVQKLFGKVFVSKWANLINFRFQRTIVKAISLQRKDFDQKIVWSKLFPNNFSFFLSTNYIIYAIRNWQM